MSAFTVILAGLSAALQVAPALAGGNISTNRLRPIPAGQSMAIVLRLSQAEGTEYVLGSLSWKSAYTVECYARATAGSDPVAAVDALLVDVWQRLAALGTDALGADITINPQIDWQYDDAETPVVCAVIQLAALHHTNTSNLQPST
jgi:hypothetical protein